MPDLSLQLQADNLPQESLEGLLVEGHWAPVLTRLLTGENLLLEGCRGEGKTMLMRAAVGRLAKSVNAGGKVLGVHATFKRYLATIPPPGVGGEAELGNFKAWVNARILGAVRSQLESVFGEASTQDSGIVGRVDWQKLISLLETTYRGVSAISPATVSSECGLSLTEFVGLQGYTLPLEALKRVAAKFGLDLIVLLLDDAAHALDTRAQGEFFTLIKALYAPGLAFKISVYPAVTRYGLDFSYGHDAVVVSLGVIPDRTRMTTYVDLLNRRLEVVDEENASKELLIHLLGHQEWIKLLVYCSNGNPRGLLKLVSQVLTELGANTPDNLRYEDIRKAVNYVMDRHLDNMVPGIIKDLDPRLMQASHLLLNAFRERLSDTPGPLQGNQPRMFLAITNSLQIPYLCTAAVRLLVAANVLTPEGPARLGKRENATTYLLHPGFVFRDNALAKAAGAAVTISAERWLEHFDAMSPRVHADLGKSAPLWEEVREEAMQEPSGHCINGHPMTDLGLPCEECGARATPRSRAEILLDKDISVLDLSDAIKTRLRDYGFTTVRIAFEAAPAEIDAIPYIGVSRTREIRSAVEAAVDEFFAG